MREPAWLHMVAERLHWRRELPLRAAAAAGLRCARPHRVPTPAGTRPPHALPPRRVRPAGRDDSLIRPALELRPVVSLSRGVARLPARAAGASVSLIPRGS